MASLTTINSSNFIDSILPSYGQKRISEAPIWNEAMNMFIINEHESMAGNRSYDGVRIADNFMIIEHIGLFHSFSFLNGIDIYCFDGRERKLISKKQYGTKTYYDKDLVRRETEMMMHDYICQQAQAQNITISSAETYEQARKLVSTSYRSYKDENIGMRIMNFRQLLLE